MAGRYSRSTSVASCGTRALLAGALLLLPVSTALAQTSIDTISGWNGSTFISSFGVTNTATYGQTVTVAAGAGPLNSFSFEIGNCSANVSFRGSVYAWDGSKATGASLYQSGVMSVAAGSTYNLVTFNTGGITLPAGTYVLFASTSEDQGGAPNSACRWGAVAGNTAYTGGNFVFLNNGTATSQWTGTNWSSFSQDLAFQVNGISVSAPPAATGAPAASTTSLLIGFAALSGLAFLQFRKYHHSA